MAEVLLFHHAQGLTPGIRAFADEMRAAGHTVHTPDLFEGKTFASIDEGLAHAKSIGFETILEKCFAPSQSGRLVCRNERPSGGELCIAGQRQSQRPGEHPVRSQCHARRADPRRSLPLLRPSDRHHLRPGRVVDAIADLADEVLLVLGGPGFREDHHVCTPLDDFASRASINAA